MKTELKFSIELNADQLKELLKNYVEREYGIKDAEVYLNATTHFDEFDRGPGHPIVKGATISASLDPKSVVSKLQYPSGVRGVTKEPVFKLFDKEAHIFRADHFLDSVDDGSFNSDDGIGYWATSTHESDVSCWDPQPEWASYVVWYNK